MRYSTAAAQAACVAGGSVRFLQLCGHKCGVARTRASASSRVPTRQAHTPSFHSAGRARLATRSLASGADVAYLTRQRPNIEAGHPDMPVLGAIPAQLNHWGLQSRPPPSPAVGSPQLIDATGKAPGHVIEEMRQLLPFQHSVTVTRVSAAVAQQVQGIFPGARFHTQGRTLVYRSNLCGQRGQKHPGAVCIVSGSTHDEDVAEECRLVCDHLGCYAFHLRGVSVSLSEGQYVVPNLEAIRSADVVIVASSQDTALPGLLASMVDAPLVAVPTDASLPVCLGASAVSIVNVGDGQGAAFMAMRILRQAAKLRAAAQAREPPAPAAVQPEATPSHPVPELTPGHADQSGHNGHVASDMPLGPRCPWPRKSLH